MKPGSCSLTKSRIYHSTCRMADHTPSCYGGPDHPDLDPEHENLSCTFTYITSNANENNSENNVGMLKLNGEQKININNVEVEW